MGHSGNLTEQQFNKGSSSNDHCGFECSDSIIKILNDQFMYSDQIFCIDFKLNKILLITFKLE